MKTPGSVLAGLTANWPYSLALVPALVTWLSGGEDAADARAAAAEALTGLLLLGLIALNQRQRRTLEGISITDKLTGVFNSRYLRIQLDRQVHLAHRTHTPLSLIFLDADNLKSVNDGMGHMAGDALLRKIGQILAAKIRQHMDLSFRFGGDEFLVLCPHAALETAGRIAERILHIPEEIDAPGAERITLSIGVVQLRRHEAPAEFLKRADRILYSAKRSGKNKIGYDPQDRIGQTEASA